MALAKQQRRTSAKRINNLSGQRFEALFVYGFAGLNKFKDVLWLARCNCGKFVMWTGAQLRKARSCGCQKSRLAKEQMTKHGRAHTKIYNVWLSMRRRCSEVSDKSYQDYGGRGITVCERWQSFENFLSDMGELPPDGTLERKDVNGNYEPSNCCWITKAAQARNKRNNRLLTYNGETLCVAEWSEKLGWPQYVINNRLRRRWSIERTLTTPRNCGPRLRD